MTRGGAGGFQARVRPAAKALPLSPGALQGAPEALRVFPRPEGAARMDLGAPDCAAQVPALIKAYLRLGGFVSDGAYVDRAFNTVDVCLVMDTARMSARHREFHIRKGREA